MRRCSRWHARPACSSTTSHTVGDQVGIVDFWPSEDAWGAFRGGTTGRGHERAWGSALLMIIEVVQLLNADGG